MNDEVLDSFAFSSYLITAKVGQLIVYRPKINMCLLSEPSEFLLLHLTNINTWYKYFSKFIFKTLDNMPSIEDQSNESTYYFSQENLQLKIDKKGNLPATFLFSKFELADLLVGVSHLYVVSVSLPISYQLSFTLMLNYFENLDTPNNYEKVCDKLKEFTPSLFISLFENITKDNKFQFTGSNIYCALQKYQTHYLTLYKMRMCKKILLVK